MSELAGPPPEASAVAHGRITQLDGLRAIAVISILVHHCLKVPLLWVGVDIFFVISGFLITGILLSRKSSGAGYFSYFYSRRAFRILPPYIAVMVACGLLVSWHIFQPWWAYTFFLMNLNGILAPSAGIPVPLWSLAVEEQFYLVWPFVILLLPERFLLRISIAMLVITPLLRVACTPFFPTHFYEYYLTPFRADLLCAGAALALLWKDRTPRFERICRRGWIGVLLGFGGMALAQIWPVMRLASNTRASNGMIYSLSLVGSVSLVSWTLSDRGWLLKALTWRPARFIGRISYTMYLVGSLVAVVALRSIQNKWAILAIDIAGTILWATISWYVMEQPILNYAARKTAGQKALRAQTVPAQTA